MVLFASGGDSLLLRAKYIGKTLVTDLEAKIEQEVVAWWTKRGGLQIKLNILGRRGWPDRIFFPVGGKPVLIEFKRVNENARALQAYVHGELRARGYEVYVCDNANHGKAILARSGLPERRG